MVPEERMVDWVIGTRFLAKWVSGPSGAAIFWRATSLVRIVDLGQSSPPIVSMINSKAFYRRSDVGTFWLDARRSSAERIPAPVLTHPPSAQFEVDSYSRHFLSVDTAIAPPLRCRFL